MIYTLPQLEAKIIHDETNMLMALPSLPREDSYFQALGEVTNFIAGDYADKCIAFDGNSTLSSCQYLLELYKLDKDVDARIVSSFILRTESE